MLTALGDKPGCQHLVAVLRRIHAGEGDPDTLNPDTLNPDTLNPDTLNPDTWHALTTSPANTANESSQALEP